MRPIRCFVLFALFAAGTVLADERRSIVIEAGPAFQMRNDFASPGDEGTLVRLGDETAEAVRATVVWPLSERWALRVVAAPLSVDDRFTSASPVRFENRTFAAGAPVEVEYRFDSWRAGAIYRFVPRGPWRWRTGLMLKVRDAEITLGDGTVRATKSNTGVVPLLHAGATMTAGENLSFDVDLDGAAAPQGRAIDVSVRGEWRMTRSAGLQVGVRLLDGGADNDEVYTFATFGYLFAGVAYRW